MGLFADDPVPVRSAKRSLVPESIPADTALATLGQSLPKELRYGTSSWSFPGWQGLVWGGEYTATALSRDGLNAYAAHPLLRAVGIDRTYYGPITADSFADYASQVPEDFRFMVKAWQNVTSTSLRDGDGKWRKNPDFLNVDLAVNRIIGPALDGLGERLGPLVFQFAPMPDFLARRATGFAKRLGEFLSALPDGPVYAVELRNPEFYTDEVIDAIGNASTRLCLTWHPRAASFQDQMALVRKLDPGPNLVRWMLRRDMGYADAKKGFAPFDRIVARDDDARDSITEFCREFISSGTDTTIIINNKAEGSAPASVEALARLMAGY